MVKYCYLSDGSKTEALKADGTGLVYRGSLIYRKAADGTLTLESVQIPGGRLTPGGVRYHVADHLGSVVAVVDGSTGALYQASEYAPYGERTDNAAVTVSSAPMGETFRDQFTGKEDQEPDFAVTYADFGARHYSPALGRWLVPDPLSEKYYDVSPYVYCDGNPIVLVDEWGLNPVYSLKGTFLGTDSNGLAGDYIIMNEDLFEQGMDNQEALKLAFIGPISTTILESINSHFSNLSKRPDYDGIVTIREGIDWAKAHVGALDNPSASDALYLDASKLDFGKLSVNNSGLLIDNPKQVNLLDYVNLKSLSSIYTTYALGNTKIQLLDASQGTIHLYSDKYDWDYHSGFTYGFPSNRRDLLIYLERKRIGVDNRHGFPLKFYGIGKIKH